MGGKGSLSQGFNSDGHAVEITADLNSSKVAIGQIFKIDNERIEPSAAERELRYGMPQAQLEALPAEMQESVKQQFITQEKEKYHAAHSRTLVTYEDALADAEENSLVEVADVAPKNLEAEIMTLNDHTLKALIENKIEAGESAHVAIDNAYEEKITEFLSFKNPQLAKYAVEMGQHRAVIEHHLLPDRTLARLDNMPEGAIVVSSTIALSAISSFADAKTGKPLIGGIISDSGSMQSHAALLVKSMGLPYARIDSADLARMKTGDTVILDGRDDKIFLHPGKELKQHYTALYEEEQAAHEALVSKFASKGHKRVETQDGEKLRVFANYALSLENQAVREATPSGIGLYRTEVAYDLRGGISFGGSAEKWRDILKHNMAQCAPKNARYADMTIRTLDIEGDKSDKPLDERRKDQLKMTKTQMQAIAILAAELAETNDRSKLKVMVPMIRSSEHMAEMQTLMDEQAQAVGQKTVKLGCMLEVPALIDEIETIDTAFISVGTNDLVHAMLGLPRYDSESSKKYDPTHPSVLKGLAKVTETCERRGIPLSICGDIASDPKYTPMLIGLGFHNMSSGVDSIPRVKEMATRVNAGEAREMVERMMNEPIRAKRTEILAEFNEALGLSREGRLDLSWQQEDAAPEQTHDHS